MHTRARPTSAVSSLDLGNIRGQPSSTVSFLELCNYRIVKTMTPPRDPLSDSALPLSQVSSAAEDKSHARADEKRSHAKKIRAPRLTALSLTTRSTDTERHRAASERSIAMRARDKRSPLTILMVTPRFL
jgi:hypothetical protein